MKPITLLLLSLMAFASPVAIAQKNSPNSLVWHTDLMKANEASVAANKPIFAFFTGSDWCGWCKRLQSDVFSKPAFIEWAKKNVILLELDFPRGKQLSPEMVQQNNGLQDALKVQGYPTVWFFYLSKDPQNARMNINALGSCGYPQGFDPGKQEVKFLADANSILAKK